ncbi:MAG: cation:proton antiporter [Muribaculaceae bacterium]|nr:cation:proton antiporter [Muribaculaceae bacterium]
MILAATTPLVTSPVLIFFIMLVIILLSPVVLNRFKIPHIIGLIVAGVVIGPHGLNVLARDMSFELFGQVGILYIMFLAGIEIDMFNLKRNLKKGLVFGLLSFLFPMIVGTLASVYILHMNWVTSILLASMYASHTLISYPIVARFGLTKSPAVLIAVVGTIISVIGALLVLAGAVNVHHTGEFSWGDLLRLFLELALYCVVILYTYPRITRWFFKNYSDNVTQYIFVMAMVFLASWFAQIIELEAVLGAFFAGLVLNRYVPNASPLMNRIEFVGNALFIPYFLIGVGMMIDVKVISNANTLYVAANMIIVAIIGKWAAAWLAQKIYGMNGVARRMMFGLTTAHTAVALAVVTIGYNMIMPDGSRMMDEIVLNGTVLMILITCAIAPIVTARAASKMRIEILTDEGATEATASKRETKILIPVANPITVESLTELALMLRNPRRKTDIYAIHVRNDNSASSRAIGRNALDIAVKSASSVDVEITPIERYDINTVAGLLNAIEERDITDVIIGMHRKATVIDSFFGAKIEQLLKATNQMVIMSRCFIPVNTVTRIVVAVPPMAQFETGFSRWVRAIGNLTREVGCRVIFCCHPDTQPLIRGVLHRSRYDIRHEYRDVERWEDFVLLSNRILEDDLFVVVSARESSVSHNDDMADVPGFLQKYFSRNNLIVLYPEQFGQAEPMNTFVDPMSSDIHSVPSPLWFKLHGAYRKLVQVKKSIFKREPRKKIDL